MFFHQALQQSRAKERNWKAEDGESREKKKYKSAAQNEGMEAGVVNSCMDVKEKRVALLGSVPDTPMVFLQSAY